VSGQADSEMQNTWRASITTKVRHLPVSKLQNDKIKSILVQWENAHLFPYQTQFTDFIYFVDLLYSSGLQCTGDCKMHKNILRSCSVRMFSTACGSASITSNVSQWWPFSFIFKWGNREKSQGAKLGKYGGWGMTVMLLLVKNSLVKKEV
jgi:hypothetical protein